MNDMYVKVSDLAEYCDTNSSYLHGKGQSVAQAALRRVKEFAIENAADVQPVKHGQWIGINEYCKKNGYIPSGMGVYYWCSECGKGETKISDYCPNCGARMDGDAEC